MTYHILNPLTKVFDEMVPKPFNNYIVWRWQQSMRNFIAKLVEMIRMIPYDSFSL